MAVRFSTGLRTRYMESGLDDWYDAKVLEIRVGAQPASANDAPTGTVTTTITLPADAMGAVAAGVMSKAGTWEDSAADATGTPGWGRIRAVGDSGGSSATDQRLDFSVGGLGSGADLELDFTDADSPTDITIGDVVTISVATVTQPAE